GYQTSIAWETFRVRQITQLVQFLGLQLGVLFLAIAGLDAALPYARRIFTREARARFGRGAAIAAMTAMAIAVIALVANRHLESRVRSAAEVTLFAPAEAAMALPALVEIAQSLLTAIIVSAAVALFTVAARTRATLFAILGLFFVMLDPGVTLAQAPLMLVRTLAAALVVWLIARYVLDANPLAWPATIFLALTLSAAATFLQHTRPDLIANGIALMAIAAGVVVWLLAGGEEDDAAAQQGNGESGA
ncbi:MAG TPA: hypothetical protein VFO89_09900, partial [Thermoanaerobaculia bacterium]|nr:hypothetical protein [Thermoanaerobaculia bacterium]